MITYDKVVSEVNQICDSDCYKVPKKSCPYYCVCKMRFDGSEMERTAEFELAMVARYLELNNKN